ncbi:gephyrin-like molybdotransferase Glp [Luteimicrobium subarcticum]|uniref:Molybdopterin molybdenumtransferase n=1 Tax=Luteimicrobium subarcticum TaxID=620910 RepID=A0A2M8W1V6_9MICO|nr:gephyrin-like molybdotransferase Glp [Luteimicrobium subarcticum]PJI84900.1 molybdenum cofactor synthesis domain-containing protein [Luteimicrobium subarcticum]
MTRPSRTVDEHLVRALALVRPLPVDDVPLDEAVGAVLAADVAARFAVPPFDTVAMDGYALARPAAPSVAEPDAPPPPPPRRTFRTSSARDDVDNVRLDGWVTLRVVGDVPAGSSYGGTVGPGEAVRVMTGAPLPAGADVVVPVERTRGWAERPAQPGTPDAVVGAASAAVDVPAPGPGDRPHVRRAGEDVTAGTVVAHAGDVVTSRLAALAAAVGHGTLPVHRTPLVAVLSTGDELVPAGEPLAAGRIPDANSVLLAGAAREAGARSWRRGGVGDTPAALAAALDDAVAAGADLIVTTGGVSVGAHDVVRDLLDGSAGSPRVTDAQVVTVGMAPGKPQGLARWRGVPWVAAPGNPTGASASFELFARPMIDRLRGLSVVSAETVSAEVPETVRVTDGWSSPPGRVQVVPVRALPDGRAARAGDGHQLSSLAAADGIALVGPDVDTVAPGDAVPVRWFPGAGRVSAAPTETGVTTGAAGTRTTGAARADRPLPPDPVYDAVILAGGRAERLGTSKPGVDVAGGTLLEHALRAASGAVRVVVVGPDDLADDVGDRAVLTREDPPFGGPAAGIAAGLAALDAEQTRARGDDRRASADRVLVLACDVPRAAGAVPLLLAAAARTDDGAFLVRDGRAQWLVGVYARPALDDALAALAASRTDGLHGASVRALVAPLACAEVPDPDGLSADVDTWADVARFAASDAEGGGEAVSRGRGRAWREAPRDEWPDGRPRDAASPPPPHPSQQPRRTP